MEFGWHSAQRKLSMLHCLCGHEWTKATDKLWTCAKIKKNKEPRAMMEGHDRCKCGSLAAMCSPFEEKLHACTVHSKQLYYVRVCAWWLCGARGPQFEWAFIFGFSAVVWGELIPCRSLEFPIECTSFIFLFINWYSNSYATH